MPVGKVGTGSSAGSTFLTKLLTGTRSFASGFFTMQRLVEIMPRFSGKRQVVGIANQIESDISAYLLTITAMNAAVGVATAAVMWITGVGDPVLWGTVAFLLNFVPILGPLAGVLIFLLAGASFRQCATIAVDHTNPAGRPPARRRGPEHRDDHQVGWQS